MKNRYQSFEQLRQESLSRMENVRELFTVHVEKVRLKDRINSDDLIHMRDINMLLSQIEEYLNDPDAGMIQQGAISEAVYYS